jgi:thiamine pyrophosphokinase
MRPEVVVVVAGGESLPAALLHEIPEGAYVIAADGGLDQARKLGLEVALVIGDLDSTIGSPAAGDDPETVRLPVDKDLTDLEAALTRAASLDPDRIVVLGGFGGRLGHLIANANLIAAADLRPFGLEWVGAGGRVTVVTDVVELHGSPGDLVALVPVGGDCGGVSARGFRWELDGATLEFGTTRGVSNEMTSPVAKVTVGHGCLLVIQEFSRR